jgi:hypothetical protein
MAMSIKYLFLFVWLVCGVSILPLDAQSIEDFRYLREVGLPANSEEIEIVNSYTDSKLPIRHIYFTPKLNGRKLLPIISSIHFNVENGKLVQKNINEGKISEQQLSFPKSNFESAFKWYINYRSAQDIKFKIESNSFRQANTNRSAEFVTRFVNINDLNDAIIVEEVYCNLNDDLIPAYHISHISSKDNLTMYLSIADGKILVEDNKILECEMPLPKVKTQSLFSYEAKSNSIASNSYEVFELPDESPNHNARKIVTAPWLKNTNASPLGWHHDGLLMYQITKGNNANVYEDMDGNNAPSPGDTSYVDGGLQLDFSFPYSKDSAIMMNRNAAITNAFYWTNTVHDLLYNYGFAEQESNFQYSNFGKGGTGGDPVKVEVYDEINDARNNANFGTPPEGISPLMQVYAWQQPSFDTMVVNSPASIAGKYAYVPGAIGPKIKSALSADIAFPKDGSAYPTCGCASYNSYVRNKIVFIDRGICSYIAKITRAQDSGAIAIVICNQDNNPPVVIGGYISSSSIPIVMMSKANCDVLRLVTSSTINATLLPPSEIKFKSNQKSYPFANANFGPAIPKYLQGDNIQIQDNLGNFQDACDPIVNNIENKIVFIDEGNCEVSFKVYQAQLKGAAAAVVCNLSGNEPDTLPTGSFGHLISIPTIGMSKSNCDSIKMTIPSTSTFENNLPPLLNGEMDAGLIAHEYGHGVSLRLTGGGAGSCLTNQEQAGEGWSDFFGLMLTTKPTHRAYDNRGIGTFVSGDQINEVGIRPYPYNVDTTINPARYSWLKDQWKISMPHGIGYVWCSMIWDLNWALTKTYGFESNLFTPNSTKGNAKSLNLIMLGLKLQVCSPGFVDARNAILKADSILYNGQNSCIIWNIFARRGLGFSANQGSPYRRDDGVEAFDLPVSCSRLSDEELFGLSVLAADEVALFATAEQNTISLKWRISESLKKFPFKIYKKKFNDDTVETIFEGEGNLNNLYIDSDVDFNESYYYQIVFGLATKELQSSWVSARLNDKDYNWSIHPNPAKDKTKIIFIEKIKSNSTISLFNAVGFKLDEFELVPNQNEVILNTENLKSGMYFLQCKIGANYTTKKLEIIH